MRKALLAPLTVVAVTLTLTGCKGIDKSQWRDFPAASSGTQPRSGSAGTGSTVIATTSSGQTVIVDQRTSTAGGGGAAVAPNDVTGVVAGASAGGVRSGPATVNVRTDPGTCWVLVVDGNTHNGCGNATLTDTRGDRAGRVTKVRGSAPITLQLVAGGQVVASGTVQGDYRYVTVRG